jgi:hypothetical protein
MLLQRKAMVRFFYDGSGCVGFNAQNGVPDNARLLQNLGGNLMSRTIYDRSLLSLRCCRRKMKAPRWT